MNNYNHTIRASFVGYIVQAIVNMFAPLLFVTFQSQYGIPLAQITVLITVNFLVQLAVDLAAAFFIDKIGYRISVVAAHIFAVAGFVLMVILPGLTGSAFTGLLISVVVYAIGGGLLEVLISPIVEACPTDNKGKTMSMLHSFYCWGCVGVIGLSTLFFALFGTEHWKILALIWAAVPLVNAIIFTRVPLAKLGDGEKGMPLGQLFKNKMFWLFFVLMFCAGACEQAVSQWASTFAEQGLGVTKAIGDLAGPLAFSVLMGLSRLLYGKFGDRMNLDIVMAGSAVLCVAAYLITALSSNPVFALIGVGLCGFSVGILWPGTFSKASATVKGGGTAMFAVLALAGDLGCSAGPTFVGLIADASGGSLQTGILFAVALPVMLFVTLFVVKSISKKDKNKLGK